MKIFVCCSKYFYDRIPQIKTELERLGHIITPPNSYDAPFKEEEMKKVGSLEHAVWKAEMLKKQIKKVEENDAIFALNFEKNGQANYIGGATFLEIYEAFRSGKKIFFCNPVPEGKLKDELLAFRPIIVGESYSLIQ